MNHQMIVGDSTLYFLKDEGYFSGCGYLGWPIDQGKLQDRRFLRKMELVALKFRIYRDEIFDHPCSWIRGSWSEVKRFSQ